MNNKFIALPIACASFGVMFAPPAVGAQERNERQEFVKISGEAFDVRQCVQPASFFIKM